MWRIWLILITLVRVLVGNSIGLSIGGIEDLRTRSRICTIVLTVAINLVKSKTSKMFIIKVFFAIYPFAYFVQFSLIPNAVQGSLKDPVCADLDYSLERIQNS